jgi:60 kDa SS-A/Ro ribonucleoprotein
MDKSPYLTLGSNRPPVPQTQPIPGREADMAKNHQGGYAFTIGDWARLERFLILGTDAGTYYVDPAKHTIENFDVVKRCVAKDARRVVELVYEMSIKDRAPKASPLLLALAYAIQKGQPDAARYAREIFPEIARTGSWLLESVAYLDQFGGWGRGKRQMIEAWYNRKAKQVAYQVLKYRNRKGWTHRDVMRVAHPYASTTAHEDIFRWATSGLPAPAGDKPHPSPALVQIWAYERAKIADKEEIIELIERYKLSWEMLPSKWLTDKDVWRTLLYNNLPKTALIRNLGRLTRLGVIKPLSESEATVSYLLTNGKGRLPHPMATLIASGAYAQMHDRHGNAWSASQRVLEALDTLFNQGFGTIKPAGKRTLLAIDCSKSMTWNIVVNTHISAMMAASAMAMVTVRTEPKCHTVGFSDDIIPLPVSKSMGLREVHNLCQSIRFGGTYCDKPMTYALKNGLEVDTFIIYTDNETAHGLMHPSVALKQYRQRSGIPAKLIVAAMTATEFSIADPKDPGMLDVVGMDAGMPNVISAFSAANIG